MSANSCLHLDHVELDLFSRGVVLHLAELGIPRSELQSLWRQHGLVVLLPTVAEPCVPRVGVAADEGLRDLLCL